MYVLVENKLLHSGFLDGDEFLVVSRYFRKLLCLRDMLAKVNEESEYSIQTIEEI